MYIHTTHAKKKLRIPVGMLTKHIFKFRQTHCLQTRIWVNADKRTCTWISQVVAVFHQPKSEPVFLHSIQPVEPLSPDTLTPSPKWFLFISCKSPNQSWKLNAIQRSHRFQLHSLSLWKWMAAAENSDVLSHHDRESLNASCDLYCCCFWLKGLVGDSTNHVTHLTPYIWVLFLLCVSLSHPLSVLQVHVWLIKIITAWEKSMGRSEI